LIEKLQIVDCRIAKCDQCGTEIEIGFWSDIFNGLFQMTAIGLLLGPFLLLVLVGKYLLAFLVATGFLLSCVAVVALIPIRKKSTTG
jgi:hypothetical protein